MCRYDGIQWQIYDEEQLRGSKNLFHYCQDRAIPFIYASSASTYGNGTNGFVETPEAEEALNPYAYSKLLFDRYVRKFEGEYTAQVVGCVISMFLALMKHIRIKWHLLYAKCFIKTKKQALSICLKAQMAMKMVAKHVISSM